MKKFIAFLFCVQFSPIVMAGGDTVSPEGAAVYLITPANGSTHTGPVKVVFGLSGMGIAPAGIVQDNTGHHHLIIDAELPDLSMPIPSDEHYRHFGKGQTETTIELAPGNHTLQMLLGDFKHVAHNPPVVSEKITITVE